MILNNVSGRYNASCFNKVREGMNLQDCIKK